MSNRRRVSEALEDAGGGSIVTLAPLLPDLSKKQIQHALYKLETYGEIVVVGAHHRPGHYGKPCNIYEK